MDPRCKFVLVVAKMDYSHPSCSSGEGTNQPKRGNQTIVIVPVPHPGVKCVRPLTVFGYDDAPHGHAEVWLENVELDESAVVLGEGRGFEISQSRLGPGRIHHCKLAWEHLFSISCISSMKYPGTYLSLTLCSSRYEGSWIG